MSALAQSLPDVNYDAFCKFEVMKSDKFKFVMEIPDFSLRPEKQDEFLLENFSINGPGSKITYWLVVVYPRGIKTRGPDNNSLTVPVNLFNASNEDVRLKCSISYGHNQESKEHIWVIKGMQGKIWDVSRHITSNDLLRIVFEITVFGESKKTMKVIKSTKNTEFLSKNFHQDQLTNDLHLLFNSKEYADVTITCGGKVFDCHRVILASRSPVFKTMFDSNMREKNTASVEIKNMAPDVLENLLLYIYTGNAPSIDQLSEDLLAAADQYQVEKLKALCEKKLCEEIGLKNCIYLLMLGDLHSASTLKTQALRFLSQNIDKIKIIECKKALISNPTLLFEVMENILPTTSVNDNDDV